MCRLGIALCLVLLGIAAPIWVFGQDTAPPRAGDPPVAALIQVSQPDLTGRVTVTGESGAVFPSGEVLVQNLHTGETVYAYSGMGGNFQIALSGGGVTPYYVASTTARTFNHPGTIVYGPEWSASAEGTVLPVTQIYMDGGLEDWQAYPGAQVDAQTFAFLNTESLYLGLFGEIPASKHLVVDFSLNNVRYELSFDPLLPQTALLYQTAPDSRDLGTRAIAVAANIEQGVLEVRMPVAGVAYATIETAALNRIFTRTTVNGELVDFNERVLDAEIPIYAEQDGIVHPGEVLTNAMRFSTAGTIARGASYWTGEGRVNTLHAAPGERIILGMDVMLRVPALGQSLVGLDLTGEIDLLAVSTEAGYIATQSANNGWSSVLTPSGMPVYLPQEAITVGRVLVPAAQTVRKGDTLLAGFHFELNIPQELPAGLYVPVFRGGAKIGDSETFAWSSNGLFGNGAAVVEALPARLPLVFNVGGFQEARLLWTLFYEQLSGGSRGVLPAEDSTNAGLLNRVTWENPSYILPQGVYSIEPYLLNMLPNTRSQVVAPLLPLQFPGGTLRAVITRPDGRIDTLPETEIVQNRVSPDDSARIGGAFPTGIYCLTTRNPQYTAYPFDTPGDYVIELTGTAQDIYGNRYSGGGTYAITIAERLVLSPGVLQGTPFDVGDSFFAGVHLAPGMPADVVISVKVYPADGSDARATTLTGTANANGYLALENAVQFDTPGEYVIDYEARHTDFEGRLWAGSVRSAGIIATPDSRFVAHGARGLPNLQGVYRPAWFLAAQYPPPELRFVSPTHLYYPYYLGDLAFLPVSATTGGVVTGMTPVLRVRDLSGDYAAWLQEALPGDYAIDGLSLDDLALSGELPVQIVDSYGAYAYLSAVRPDAAISQMVLGTESVGHSFSWSTRDPFNGQLDSVGGLRAGEYVFLFGGVVMSLPEGEQRETSAYASVAMIRSANMSLGISPSYHSSLGGLSMSSDAVLFHPTGIRPGDRLTVGDRLVIAGQAVPTLESQVIATVLSPGGVAYTSSGLTNPTGYYYRPADDVVVTEAGAWTVSIWVTSLDGAVVGDVPGTENSTFVIDVVDTASQ